MASRSASASRRITTFIVVACLPTLCLLLASEVVLRWTGAAERCPIYKDSLLWVCDPLLYFKSNPGQVFNGEPLINHAGFRGRQFDAKRAGVYRILALGDSCTFGILRSHLQPEQLYISEPYPQALERLAAAHLGPDRVEVLNAGVPGYNSYQGLMLLRGKLRGLAPDLITVRFGWNDHFMSAERRGGDPFREPATAAGRFVEDLLLHSALYPFSRRLGMELQLRLQPFTGQSAPQAPHSWQPNVSLDGYRHNLRRIVEVARAHGSAVWLLTAPHALLTDDFHGHPERLPSGTDAELLLTLSAIPSIERLIEIHESYNDVTREVAVELGVPLIDLEAIYRQHASEHLFAAGDLLHPTQAGHDLEAKVLFERLISSHLVTVNDEG
jgi:lysophospholipase L1-like esterase